ncbi:MFS transporter [Brevibacterium ammoniilyticum]|uniref:MFS transporter n=2 Tax=Brevibacterium ammoniilyticum TaxID=1046555 RepID=A0ABP9TYW4_9MICO
MPGLWPTMVPLLMGILCGALGVSMINTALPAIALDLDVPESMRAWIVDVYPLATAVTIVVAARCGDRFGRRRMFALGTIGYAAAASLAAFSPGPAVLIGSRVLMGMAGAFIIASVVSTVGALFTGRSLVIANGLWMAVFGLGNSLGPVLGGLFTELWGWRSVLASSTPLALAAAGRAVAWLPETRSQTRVRFDPLSIVASGAGVGAVVAGIKLFAVDPLAGSLWSASGLVLLVAFVVRQRRLEAPLIAVELFTRRRFSSAAIQLFVSAATAAASIYLLSIHLQAAVGRSPAAAGMALVPQAVATVAGGLLAPWVALRLGRPAAIAIALGFQALGLASLALAPTASPVPLVLVGLGFGFIGTVATTALFESSPRSSAGQVGAIQEVAFALGGGAGVAVFATLALLGGPHGFALALIAAASLTLASAFLAIRRTPTPDSGTTAGLRSRVRRRSNARPRCGSPG